MPRLPGHGLAVPDMREARPLPWERSKTHAKPPRERLCACQGWRYGAGALSGGSAALGAWHRSDWERCIISREGGGAGRGRTSPQIDLQPAHPCKNLLELVASI